MAIELLAGEGGAVGYRSLTVVTKGRRSSS
jgi:hypothetical protein